MSWMLGSPNPGSAGHGQPDVAAGHTPRLARHQARAAAKRE